MAYDNIVVAATGGLAAVSVRLNCSYWLVITLIQFTLKSYIAIDESGVTCMYECIYFVDVCVYVRMCTCLSVYVVCVYVCV
jgi:hypothetical protein